MRKGITPIISIIILLLITISLAGAAWTFLQGVFFPQITKTFMIPTGGSYCTNILGVNTIIVYVINTGYQSMLTSSDFNLIAIDSNSTVTPYAGFGSVPTGQSGKLVEHDCGGSCTSNHHTVDIGTVSSIQHLSVFCP